MVTQRACRFVVLSALLLASMPVSVSAQSQDAYLDYSWLFGVRQDGLTGFAAFCGQNGLDGNSQTRVFISFPLSENTPLADQLKLKLDVESYIGPDASETIDIFAVEGTVTNGHAFYEDLGGGANYGTAVVQRSDRGTAIMVELNATAIDAFNKLSRYSLPDYYSPGVFRIGLAIATPFTSAPGDEGVGFGLASHQGDYNHQLLITPTTVAVEGSTWGRIKALYRGDQ